MIDTKNFTLLDLQGFGKQEEAYQMIKEIYSSMNGVTTYFDRERKLYYIVQSRVIKEL